LRISTGDRAEAGGVNFVSHGYTQMSTDGKNIKAKAIFTGMKGIRGIKPI
jgi:hypothetical protein